MWLPLRLSSVPSHQETHGYSINSVTGARFPSPTGFMTYTCPGYQSLFEALETLAIGKGRVDVMSLDFGPTGNRSTFGAFNPCQHYKRTASVVQGNSTYDSISSGQVWHNYNIPTQNFWDGNYVGLNLDPRVAFGYSDGPFTNLGSLWGGTELGTYNDAEGLDGIACERMLPGIRPATSIINSIYELKDLRTLPHTITRISKALDQLAITSKGKVLPLFASKPARWAKKSLSSILNAGADSYLQGSFNLLPLLQDITATFNGYDNVDNQLKQLVAHSGKPQKRHWGADLVKLRDDSKTYSGLTGGFYNPSTTYISRNVRYGMKRFSATLEFSYEMPKGSYQENLVHGLADYHRFGISPQVIWNAIPWSFVVDWVIGIGPWLGQFTSRQLEIVTHISSFGWSIHVIRTIECVHGLVGRVSMVTEDSYFRTPAQVPLISSLQTSGLSSKEFSLGAALTIPRLKLS